MKLLKNLLNWVMAVGRAWYGWVGASATVGIVGFGQGMGWWSAPSKSVYVALLIAGLTISMFQAWRTERINADQAHDEARRMENKYFDERPKLGLDILSPEGMKDWQERGPGAQIYLRHLGGRIATSVRFDPLISKMGKYCLLFDPLPHIDPQVRNSLIYDVQNVGASSLGYQDRDKIGDISKEPLRLFVLDSPSEPICVEYTLRIHYKDNDEKRSHQFHLRFDQHRFRFCRDTA